MAPHTKKSFSLFDPTGLDSNTIRTMYVMIYSVIGGMAFTNITTGVALMGYVKELGASDFLYGIFVALIPLANSFQFLVSYLLETRLERTKTFFISHLVQRLVWIPIALIPFVIPQSAASLRLWSAGLLMFVGSLTYPFGNVSFLSLCADIVPSHIRGRYFAVRSRVATIGAFVTGMIVAWLLGRLPGFQGYLLVFLMAAILGLLDISCFFFTKLPPMRRTSQTKLSSMLCDVWKNRNFRKICSFSVCWYFGVYLASAFSNVYAKQSLGWSDTQLIWGCQLVVNLFSILVAAYWGRSMDRFGNRPVALVTAAMTATVPLLWSFTTLQHQWLFIAAQIMSGMSWASFEVSAQNLLFSQSPDENRPMYIAMYFLCTQLPGTALGNAAGGWLLDVPFAYLEGLGQHFLYVPLTRYHYLFILAFLLRSLSLLWMLVIREEGTQSTLSLLREMVWDLRKLPVRVKQALHRAH